MSKRTHFTTVTPLPAGITRETVLSTLHSHTEMIDLNPLVIERHPIKPPREASPEEINCQWYSVSDKINYIPGLYTGVLSFNACFHDLSDGLQTHILAPMGLDMKGRWTLGGTLPGEPRQPVELGHGVPKTGLWLREDVDMKCNMVMTSFVRKTTKKTHSTLVERLIEKSHVKEADTYNKALKEQIDLRSQYPPDYHSSSISSGGGGTLSPTPASSQFMDGKPPLQHTLSVSDAGSLRSAGGSIHDPRHSLHDPRQSYPFTPQQYHQQQLAAPYQPYQPAPAYAAPLPQQPHPQFQTTTTPPPPMANNPYPAPLNVQHSAHHNHNSSPPYPVRTPPPAQHMNVELPNQDAKSPVELAGADYQPFPR